MPSVFHVILSLLLLGSTLGIVSENLETVTEQMNKWHSDCESRTSKANGKGHFFRQCMKDHRTQARQDHAKNLRKSLGEEINDLKQRKSQKITSSNNKESSNQYDGKPHILLITTDQQRQDSLGCYSNMVARQNEEISNKFQAQTPHIDQLARDGMLIPDAWAASPVCSPSRTSILLGVHVPVHGVVSGVPIQSLSPSFYVYICICIFLFLVLP